MHFSDSGTGQGACEDALRADSNISLSVKKKQETIREIKLRAEVAAMTTLAKAQGQEISEQDAEDLIRQQKLMKSNEKRQG